MGCYFSQKDMTRLILLDAHRLVNANIYRYTGGAKAPAFQVRTAEQDVFVFACASEAEYDRWIEELERAKAQGRTHGGRAGFGRAGSIFGGLFGAASNAASTAEASVSLPGSRGVSSS